VLGVLQVVVEAVASHLMSLACLQTSLRHRDYMVSPIIPLMYGLPTIAAIGRATAACAACCALLMLAFAFWSSALSMLCSNSHSWPDLFLFLHLLPTCQAEVSDARPGALASIPQIAVPIRTRPFVAVPPFAVTAWLSLNQ
jgi:hypothetical protein